MTEQKAEPPDAQQTAWLSEDQQRTWRAYLAASNAVAMALEVQLQRDADMPHTYYELLVRLSEAPHRALRMSVLATSTQSSRSRLSHAIGALEQRGWVRREPCPTDRRGQNAVLTEAGLKVLDHAAPGHVGAVREVLFDALDAAQQHALRDACEAILAHAPEPGDL